MKKNKLQLILILSLLGLSTPGKAQDMYYWGKQQQKANNLFKQGEYASALSVYMRVAEETASPYSQIQIAWIYERGLGVERNCKEAVRWYTHAANSGNQSAQNNLYVLYSNGCSDLTPNEMLGIKYLKMSADSGNSRAQSNLAWLYANGEKVQKNPYQAYDLAQRSAKQNDISGILQLSIFYIEGVGVPINFNKAYSLLSNAATMEVDEWDKNKSQKAQFMLGELLFEGKGVSKDIGTAYQWFLLSSSGSDKTISNSAKKYIEKAKGLITKKEIEISTKKASSFNNNRTSVSQEDLVAALNQSIQEDRKGDVVRLAKILASQNIVLPIVQTNFSNN